MIFPNKPKGWAFGVTDGECFTNEEDANAYRDEIDGVRFNVNHHGDGVITKSAEPVIYYCVRPKTFREF